MILLFMALGVAAVAFLVIAFEPKKLLLEGGWDEKLIDAVKRFFHTTHLYKS